MTTDSFSLTTKYGFQEGSEMVNVGTQIVLVEVLVVAAEALLLMVM